MSYIDYKYYTETYGGSIITASDAPKAFQTASNTIDVLTYCRIVSRGLDGLTEFQKGIVQWAACSLADWQTENADMLNSPYNSYSINGVSASWGSGSGVQNINGVVVPASVYSELKKTGLCYRGVM